MGHYISSKPSVAEMQAMAALVSGASSSGGSSGGDCPDLMDPDDMPDVLKDFLDTAQWRHPNLENGPFEWEVLDDPGDAGKKIWQVKISTEGTPPVPPPPPATEGKQPPAIRPNRSRYDLETRCPYRDFHLKLEFRCPNLRCVWNFNQVGADTLSLGPRDTPCDSPVFGIRNWGNSGVKAYNRYEVQIHDSYNAKSVPPGSDAVLPDPMNLDGDCSIPANEICGALYKAVKPTDNVVKAAVNKKFEYSPVPDGEWNTLEIFFMAPRFTNDAAKTKTRCATFKVILNGTTVQDKVALAGVTSGPADEKKDLLKDLRYAGEDWLQSTGRIRLQEHDNRVQFRRIQLNIGWFPKKGDGSFDEKWQQEWDDGMKVCKVIE